MAQSEVGRIAINSAPAFAFPGRQHKFGVGGKWASSPSVPVCPPVRWWNGGCTEFGPDTSGAGISFSGPPVGYQSGIGRHTGPHGFPLAGSSGRRHQPLSSRIVSVAFVNLPYQRDAGRK